jgi:hypothetical protein
MGTSHKFRIFRPYSIFAQKITPTKEACCYLHGMKNWCLNRTQYDTTTANIKFFCYIEVKKNLANHLPFI